jgi:hypothetical protein
LSYTSSPFCFGYFGDRVSRTVCPVWPQTSILLISVSQIARITGVSHRCATAWTILMLSNNRSGEETMSFTGSLVALPSFLLFPPSSNHSVVTSLQPL